MLITRVAAASPRWPQSAASRRALAKLSTELIDEGASRCQIGKAPAVKDLPLPNNRTPVTQLNMSRLMKGHDPAA
jgi:uncharacterized protein YjiS (DUF1127 family)